MKKLIAISLAVMLLCVCSISVFAAETTLPDIPVSAWWTTWSSGIEIPAEGVVITFTAKAGADAKDNWNGPSYFLYSANVPNAGGVGPWTAPAGHEETYGYAEHWIQRGDSYGWHLSPDTHNSALTEAINALGIYYTANSFSADANGDGDVWDDYRAALLAGVECKITAKRTGDEVEVVMDVAGCVSTVKAAVEAGKTAYLCLSVDNAELKNIKVNVNKGSDETGDPIAIVVALLAVSGMGITVVSKKKF